MSLLLLLARLRACDLKTFLMEVRRPGLSSLVDGVPSSARMLQSTKSHGMYELRTDRGTALASSIALVSFNSTTFAVP